MCVCVENKKQQAAVGCQLGYTTHYDNSQWSATVWMMPSYGSILCKMPALNFHSSVLCIQEIKIPVLFQCIFVIFVDLIGYFTSAWWAISFLNKKIVAYVFEFQGGYLLDTQKKLLLDTTRHIPFNKWLWLVVQDLYWVEMEYEGKTFETHLSETRNFFVKWISMADSGSSYFYSYL